MHSKPKKSLGQNFLVDRNIQRKLVEFCDFSRSDSVLEIGSGQGAMTGLIADKVKKLFALEIDSSLIPILKESLAGRDNAEVIHHDILKFDIKQLGEKKIKVFGNIPYYITSPIIERLLNYKEMISEIFLTVQKEFGQRIAASPGSKEYGSFSCFTQYYLEPKILFTVKKNSFHPVPKVDSCFLRLLVRKTPAVDVRDEQLLFKIIRTSFQQRRKTLRNSLADVVSKEKLEEFFAKYKINPKIRPEELSLQQFAYLVNQERF
ncbi:MAG: 16S rRNA (adenine(1518)-N(6)/adenine(1519)-N(6))-dimethyltransferase RsmA [Candidatus Omnitrophica bacterium]|jgi:16S rRNA (adenine1518-N6/adenine1519-N6)-dimethyltransferase|nr:16S rRNA (adenine(1518)-N(6)/adenine(1519)-N(6))-dimethyltransferase RsmA [Candidatus Omnitrophota bacterium]MDD5078887.1 16S rRNA (adenine(1518)-N(6)/adenine(1519)-N(6))-dimethyltransferase RsmA [Candidatus Omnitrophota bacterium]